VHVQLHPDTGIPALYLLSDNSTVAASPPTRRATASWGIFLNVPAGEYDLEFSMEDGQCTWTSSDLSGWPARDGRPNVARGPVNDRTNTYAIALACAANSEPSPVQ
jgi:hypothetical protein